MKRIILGVSIFAVVAFLLSAYCLDAATSSNLRTSGAVGSDSYNWDNGNTWNLMKNKEGKIYYLIGLENGVVLHHREIYYKTELDQIKTESKSARDSLVISGLKLSDVVTQINNFYKDSSNSTIPIVDAYVCTLLKKKGASQEELDTYTSKLREVYK